jgi:hypothetical protein
LFELHWADMARDTYTSLKGDASKEKRYKAVRKAIRQLAKDPRYPGLQSHPFLSMKGPKGEKVLESYAENETPGAYRIFWFYGPDKGAITIFLIVPHP